LALAGVDVTIAGGSFVAITGPSGSGKSTLLHLLGGLDRPSEGQVVVDGADLGRLDDEDLTAFRRRRLGFVFQFFNLLPTLAAWENVALPAMLDGVSLASVRPRAECLLAEVGMAHRVAHRPAELSGGELQRVAIARALMSDPVLVLADEPTGNLDSTQGAEVLELLRATTSASRRTLVLVTHDRQVACRAQRVIHLVDGRLVSDDTPTGERPRR
jgi:putative ABC transport system ATP-binding protein